MAAGFYWFGGSPGVNTIDGYLVDADGNRVEGATATVADAATGLPLTTLLDASGAPVTSIISGLQGYVTFAAEVSIVDVSSGSRTFRMVSTTVLETVASLSGTLTTVADLDAETARAVAAETALAVDVAEKQDAAGPVIYSGIQMSPVLVVSNGAAAPLGTPVGTVIVERALVVALVGSGAAATANTSTATTLSVAKPAGVAVGDTILLWLVSSCATVPTISVPAGFTSRQAVSDGTGPPVYGNLFTRLADGTEGAAFNFAWSTVGNAVATVAVYRGGNYAALTSAGGVQDLSSTARPSPSLVTAAAGWVITAWGDRSGSTWTVTDTERREMALASGPSSVLADTGANVAPGTITRTATASTTTSAGVDVIVSLPAAT